MSHQDQIHRFSDSPRLVGGSSYYRTYVRLLCADWLPALTARGVQVALGLECLATVHRMIKRGELPAVKVGRVWRIRQEDLEALLAGQKSDDDAAVDEWVERALAVAPKLTEEQRNKLAELLRPARQRPGAIG